MTAEEMIPVYHGLFYACMAGAFLFAAVAAVLFFKFDIRHVFNVQSGRAERLTVERMRAENAATGRLILTADVESGHTGGRIKTPTVVQPPSSEIRPTTSLAQNNRPRDTAPIAGQQKPTAPAVPAGHTFVIRQKILLVHTNEEI